MITHIFLSILIVSIISLIGVMTLKIKSKKFILFLVSFAAGTLLGDVFIHLLPEATKLGFSLNITFGILVGILLFFILEKILHWHHCHDQDCKTHNKPLATMNLIGDGFHNFLDGALIAGSYLVSIPLGIATTIAVIFHGEGMLFTEKILSIMLVMTICYIMVRGMMLLPLSLIILLL